MQVSKYLSPNIFDPNLTWPNLFQTERTRRLAHLPSFCELVQRGHIVQPSHISQVHPQYGFHTRLLSETLNVVFQYLWLCFRGKKAYGLSSIHLGLRGAFESSALSFQSTSAPDGILMLTGALFQMQIRRKKEICLKIVVACGRLPEIPVYKFFTFLGMICLNFEREKVD